MGSAKAILVKPITSHDANRIVRAIHYSHKVVSNSQLHLGVFLDGKCGGAMSLGPSLDKRKIMGLVADTPWNGFLEFNRMAFADWLPRNSESRAIGYAMRFIRQNYPFIQWVISFADATQCGDGAIYRASGFVLTMIKENKDCMQTERSGVVHTMTVKSSEKLMSRHGTWKKAMQAEHGDFAPTKGFQLRYILFLDPTAKARLTVPILPFSEIARRGAGMYRAKPILRAGSDTKDTPPYHGGKGGSIPTPALQSHDSPCTAA